MTNTGRENGNTGIHVVDSGRESNRVGAHFEKDLTVGRQTVLAKKTNCFQHGTARVAVVVE